jgi:hypothetical protein
MKAEEAKDKLFDELKDIEEVMGVGVSKSNNINYIIIYLSKATAAILGKIPGEYYGNKVKTEITGPFKLHTSLSS